MSVRIFVGWPGFGKSLLMQDMAADATVDGHLVLALDRAEEWRAESTDREGRSRWRNDPPPIEEWPQTEDFEGLLRKLRERRDETDLQKRGCVVRFGFPWDGYALGDLARRIGHVIVADDEADYTTAVGSWNLQHLTVDCPCKVEDCGMVGYSLNAYRDFIHRGRHLPSPDDGVIREVHLWAAMRRPENVHTDVTGIAEEVALFRIGGHTTFKRIINEGWLFEEQQQQLEELEKLNFFLHRKGKRGAKLFRMAGLK